MALRVLARKLWFPATSALQRALQRASAPVMSPPASSRLLTPHSSQNGGAKRKVNGTRNALPSSKDYKRLLREMEQGRKSFEELSVAIENLPRNTALTCSAGLVGVTVAIIIWADTTTGDFDGNRSVNGGSDSQPLA